MEWHSKKHSQFVNCECFLELRSIKLLLLFGQKVNCGADVRGIVNSIEKAIPIVEVYNLKGQNKEKKKSLVFFWVIFIYY